MASSDNVVVCAEVCLVSQIPGLTNVSAEADIPARSYNKPALITVQRNTHAHTHPCATIFVRTTIDIMHSPAHHPNQHN